MKRQLAEQLLEAFARHPEIVPPDRLYFLGILGAAKRGYESLPKNMQTHQETGKYHELSLRRIVNNHATEKPTAGQKIWDELTTTFGAYSSDRLCRDIAGNGDLRQLLRNSAVPVSLLAKMKTYDYNNPDEKLFIVTRPVLVVSGVEDMNPILEWERSHTRYEQETRLWVPLQRRITAEQYFSRS